MESPITIHELAKTEPLGSVGIRTLNLAGESSTRGECLLPDTVVIHAPPAVILGTSNKGAKRLVGVSRMRLEGGPHVALAHIGAGGRLHVGYFHPGSKEFVDWLLRIRSRDYVRFCMYDLFGRFCIWRLEFRGRKFFECALEIHEASRNVSEDEFQRAAVQVDAYLKDPANRMPGVDWIPSDRSRILGRPSGIMSQTEGAVT